MRGAFPDRPRTSQRDCFEEKTAPLLSPPPAKRWRNFPVSASCTPSSPSSVRPANRQPSGDTTAAKRAASPDELSRKASDWPVRASHTPESNQIVAAESCASRPARRRATKDTMRVAAAQEDADPRRRAALRACAVELTLSARNNEIPIKIAARIARMSRRWEPPCRHHTCRRFPRRFAAVIQIPAVPTAAVTPPSSSAAPPAATSSDGAPRSIAPGAAAPSPPAPRHAAR